MTIALLLAALLCPHPHRDHAKVRAWVKTHPCPESCRTYVKDSGKFRLYQKCGRCQVDHKCALVCGGLDVPDNYQWLTAAQNRKKGGSCALCNPTNQGACAKGPP